MTDVLTLLAEANPVRVEDLAPLDLPTRNRRTTPGRRLVVAAAVVATAIAASLIGVFLFGDTSSHPTASSHPTTNSGTAGPLGPPPPTVARPLLSGKKVTLAEAAAAVGQRVVLPDTALTRPKDTGPVWAWSHDTRGIVAVTYPAARLWVDYERPAPYADPLRQLTGLSKDVAGSHVIRVAGLPALMIHGNDGTGNNDVMFQNNGLLLTVTGPYGEAKLKAVARSIVDRSPSRVARPGLNLVPYIPPRKPVSLRTASRRLGANIPLPGLRLLKRSDAGEGWAEGTCPPRGRRGCLIWIPFPADSISLFYERPRPNWPRTLHQYRVEAKHERISRVVRVDGVLVLEIPENTDDHNPGSIQFAVDGTGVTVSGYRKPAALEAIARSMVERSK